MTINATPAARVQLNHQAVMELTVAYHEGGIEAAHKVPAVAAISRAELEKRLRKIGLLKPSTEVNAFVVDLVAEVQGLMHPWIVAELVIEAMRGVISEHDREIAGK